MDRDQQREGGDSIVALFKETADSVGHLIGDHIKLTRLELHADLKTSFRRLLGLAIPLLFGMLGYAILCMGLAIALGRQMGLVSSLCLVGGVHLSGAAGAGAIAVRRLRGLNLMTETAQEFNRSVTALAPSPAPVEAAQAESAP